ncbi:MAG TPA: protein translocase subunit SecF [Syntrophomonas sp.]|jgi:preprotein translocase subunit SecF|nr:protein translocase subunit SecF [Syntrophomonas sp.]HCF71076.1 protein translocase subunit SecF [Syntrophomonas sp.]
MHLIEKRKYFYIFSSILIIAGIISMFAQGFNLSIDFKGGSLLRYKMDASISAAEVRATVEDLGVVKEANIQKSGDEFFIRTMELDQQQTSKITKGLEAKFKNVTYQSAESVGATIGSELTRNAILSVLVAMALMLVYISFRFEWTFGLAAVLALFHDVLIVLGLFSIFQWQIDSAFIAAILTVIGYSINDTIVIFDRVRENLRMKKKDDTATLLNKSIMQTLNRSINTVLTSLLPLVTLFLFGGSTIKIFILALLLGFIFGCYSSICVASPIYYEIKQRG